MKTPSFFQRSELSKTLWLFRREFAVCVIFTMVVNILMLTPTLYMLQVFDRVMLSQSELTLIVLTLVMLFFFAVMAFAEWSRSRLLVRTGIKLDEQLKVVKDRYDDAEYARVWLQERFLWREILPTLRECLVDTEKATKAELDDADTGVWIEEMYAEKGGVVREGGAPAEGGQCAARQPLPDCV